ncbi:MAG: hypothetical protein Q8Q88_12640, partial [Phenylobacterium sp.]|uniref:hypothetical protein n=1 Tax=Phenylobacterium sp. TaxID=1871053 RepID=UPI002735E9EC
FQMAAPIGEAEGLSRSIRALGFQADIVRRPAVTALGIDPEARRRGGFEDLQPQHAVAGVDPRGLPAAVAMMAVIVVGDRL